MRPQVLKMTAFGPFKGETIIDFRPFYKSGIFSLSGVTGAGKSTIFDAICFALYGKAANTKKNNDDLKSRFADDNTLCVVSLEFLVKDEIYQIERVPTQYAPGKRGKPVQTMASASLTLPKGEVLTAADEVADKIYELLQLDFSQFSKIVLLPQGEFQNFLLAKSSEKQAILSDIFDTNIYSEVTNNLKTTYEEMRLRQAKVSERIDSYITQIACGNNLELETAVAENKPSEEVAAILEEHNRVLLKQVAEVNQKRQELQNSLQKHNLKTAEKNNALLEEKEAKSKEYTLLLEKKGETEKRQIGLERAVKAKELKLLADNLHIRQENYEKQLDEQKQIASKLKALEKEIEAHKVNLKTTAELETKNTEIQNKISKLRKKQNESTVFSQKLSRLKALLQKNEDTKKAQNKQKQLVLYLENLTAQKEIAENLKLLQQIQKQAKEISSLQETLEVKNSTFEKLNSLQKTNLAAVLAESLEENKPCPVCGSLHHPQKAHMGEDVSEQELAVLQGEIANLKEQITTLQVENNSLMKQANVEPGGVEEQFQLLQNKLSVLQSENIAATSADEGNLPTLAEAQSRLAVLQNSMEQATVESEGLEKETTALKENFAEYGENGYDYLEKQIVTLNKTYENNRKTVQQIGQKQNELSYSFQVQTELLGKNKQQQNLFKEQKAEFETKFLEKQIEYNFTENYENFLLTESEEKSLQQQVNDFLEKESGLKHRLEFLDQETKGIVYTDLKALQAKIEEINKTYSVQDNLYIEIQKALGTNETVLQKLNELHKVYHRQNKLYRDYKFLYELSVGENSEKISFERYVLSVYFDEILMRANIQLDEMTKGRYQMVRKETKARRGAYSGLDIEVTDYNNGTRRDVTTLSGGETFLASLSLALGLSEVISSMSAVAATETLFIDEGFGSLDEQTLDITIGVLNKLKESGRLIGVISHVGLIKEQIDCKIEVKTGKSGSTVNIVY